jgi:hypothetical protein
VIVAPALVIVFGLTGRFYGDRADDRSSRFADAEDGEALRRPAGANRRALVG